MKNIKYLVALFVMAIVVALAVVACNKEKEKEEERISPSVPEQSGVEDMSDDLDCDDEVLELFDVSEFSDFGWAPEGTVFYYENDRMIVDAPQGWVYVGYVDGDLYVSDGSKTSVSCTCNTSGECLPGKVSFMGYTFYGCYGECSNCTMEQSEDPKPEIKGGGFVNLSMKPTFVSNPDGVLPMAFDAMLEIPRVKEMLEEFLDAFYQEKDYPQARETAEGLVILPEGYKFVPVTLCGRVLVVAIPDSEMGKSVFTSGSSEVTCSCTNGKCSPKTYGPAVICRGNCTGTCTMHDNSQRDRSIMYEIRAFNH